MMYAHLKRNLMIYGNLVHKYYLMLDDGMVDANWLYMKQKMEMMIWPLKLVVRKQSLILRKELTFIKRSVKDLCPFTNAYHKTTRYVVVLY